MPPFSDSTSFCLNRRLALDSNSKSLRHNLSGMSPWETSAHKLLVLVAASVGVADTTPEVAEEPLSSKQRKVAA